MGSVAAAACTVTNYQDHAIEQYVKFDQFKMKLIFKYLDPNLNSNLNNLTRIKTLKTILVGLKLLTVSR